MPPTATTATMPTTGTATDPKTAEAEPPITDQLHTAVTSALDIASSTLFAPYPEVDIGAYNPSNSDDDGISVLSGFASAGGHSRPSSRPNSPPPTPPRGRGANNGGAANGGAAAKALASVKEMEGASPTSVRKTPGNINTAVPGTPSHQTTNTSSSPNPPSPPKTTNVASTASSPPNGASPAWMAYHQARAEYERSEAAAEERSALLSATGGVEVKMCANDDDDTGSTNEGAGEAGKEEEGGKVEEANQGGDDNVNRTRSEVELDSFAFELESAIGLESGFSVTYEAAKAFDKAGGDGGEKEGGDKKEGLPTTFEEEALQNEADMAAVDGGEEKEENDEGDTEIKNKVNNKDGGNPDNKEATSTNDCAVLGCFGGATAAAATAANTGTDDSAATATPRFTLPTSMAEFEGFLTGLADSTNEAMTAATSPCAGCFSREPAKADEQNENDAIEVEALPKKAEEGGGAVGAADGAEGTNNADGSDNAAAGDDGAPLVRISTGPVDIDEVSHTSLLEEFGLNELNIDDTSNEGEETKKAEEKEDPAISDAYAYDNANTDSMDSQVDNNSEQKKRVTILEDPIEVASIASSNGASSLPSSPDPIPRRIGGKTDEESTVVSLTFKPPSQKKKKNKKKKKQQMMAALGMTTAAAATTAAVATPAVQTTAAPTVTPTNTSDTTNTNDDEIKKSPKKTLSTKKMFSSFKKALSTKKIDTTFAAPVAETIATPIGPDATIRMISDYVDGQASADVQNISTFELPNPIGKASGACTSALLKALSKGSNDPSTELTYADVLAKMRADLKERGLEQIPQLTASKSLNIKDPFQLNDGKGTARALLVGINYCGEKNELSGCHDDVKNMHQYLTEVAGFDEDEIMVLMDDGECPRPSKKNIINAWKELVEESEAGDSVYFHFSGHGGRIQDEITDGYDETICPVDYSKAGLIRDDENYKVLCEPMAKGVTVTSLMDSCQSGTVLDLPYTLKGNEVDKKKFMSLKNTRKTAKYFGEYSVDGKKKVSTPVIAEMAPSTPMRTLSTKEVVKEMPSTPSTDVSMGSMADDEDDAASKASC